jgi:hypothetical protein
MSTTPMKIKNRIYENQITYDHILLLLLLLLLLLWIYLVMPNSEQNQNLGITDYRFRLKMWQHSNPWGRH